MTANEFLINKGFLPDSDVITMKRGWFVDILNEYRDQQLQRIPTQQIHPENPRVLKDEIMKELGNIKIALMDEVDKKFAGYIRQLNNPHE